MTRHLIALAVVLVCLKADTTEAQDGAALYRRDCAGCHDAGVDRAPSRDALSTMTVVASDDAVAALRDRGVRAHAPPQGTIDGTERLEDVLPFLHAEPAAE